MEPMRFIRLTASGLILVFGLASALLYGLPSVQVGATWNDVGRALSLHAEPVGPPPLPPAQSQAELEAGESAGDNAIGCQFSGPAIVNTAPAPPGTWVEAWIDGVKAAETVVVKQGEKSVYSLTLDRRYAGKNVIFRFPTYPNLWRPGEAVCELNQRQSLTLSAEHSGGCGGG